jgi:tetratricopeptide (TPR) repeat protein
MGSLDEALEHHRRAFELLEPLSEAQLEIDFLHTYAETCRTAGRYDEALALHERTIELARKLGRPHDEKLAREAYQANQLKPTSDTDTVAAIDSGEQTPRYLTGQPAS